jgi:hypothetical protein
VGTHTGKLAGTIEPTGKKVEAPPQVGPLCTADEATLASPLEPPDATRDAISWFQIEVCANVSLCTQASSMLFNEQGECTQLTVGYVMDKQIGNTGGLGGVFGILYAIGYGLPFPEAQPWNKSIQYSVFNQVGSLTTELQKFMKGISGGD